MSIPVIASLNSHTHGGRARYEWMAERHYDDFRTMRGSMSFRAIANPGAFERANSLKVLRSHALCPHG